MKRIVLILLLLSIVVYPAEGAYRKSKAWESKPVGPVEINWSHPLSRGLVGCWLMNEGGGKIVKDLAKNNNGTLVNSEKFTTSQRGISCFGRGTTSGDRIVLNSAPLQGGTNFSIIALVNTLNKAQNPGNDIFFTGNRTGSATVICTIQNSIIDFSNWITDLTATYTPTDGTFNLCAFIHKSATRKIFVNGLQVASDSGNGYNLNPTAPTIGGGRDGSGSQLTEACFNGYIAFVYIYNRAISPSEIQQLYADPYCFIQAPKRRIISQVSGILQKVRTFLTD